MDKKIEGWILNGIGRIDMYMGEPLAYLVDDDDQTLGARRPLELLLAYCRYARSDALDEFEQNYELELRAHRAFLEGKRYEAKQESD